jgi:hypothetical protein
MRNKSNLASLLASCAFMAAIGLSTGAQASTYYFTASGGTIAAAALPGYGSVDVTTVGSDLKFDVEMSPNWLVETGNGTHNPIEFDLSTGGLTISSTASVFTALPSPFTQLSGSSFTNPGFNTAVNYAITCSSNGADSCGDASSLIFYVLGAGGLQPLLTADNVYLTADIYDKATGATGTVGATFCLPGSFGCPTSQGGETPLPGALPLFATGLGALGLFGWRRKRKRAAAV